MHRVTERAAKMYKHTTVTPIIKAFGGKMVGQVFISPKLQAQDPDWYTITKQRGGEG